MLHNSRRRGLRQWALVQIEAKACLLKTTSLWLSLQPQSLQLQVSQAPEDQQSLPG